MEGHFVHYVQLDWSVERVPDYDTLAFKYGEKRLRMLTLTERIDAFDPDPIDHMEWLDLKQECEAIEAECRKPERQG